MMSSNRFSRSVFSLLMLSMLSMLLTVSLLTGAGDATAAEPSSANFTSRGGHFGTSGTDLALSTATSPRFMGSGTAFGHPIAGGFSGSLTDLQTNAPGFWALFAGAFPNIDFDADGLQSYRDADDDGDGLSDVVETNTGIFVGTGDTGTNPYSLDSDGDGYGDFAEVAAMTNPNDPFIFPGFAIVPGLGLVALAILAFMMMGSGTLSFAGRRGALLISAVAFASSLVPAYEAHAAVPGQVHYQGLLLDSAGDPVDGLEDFEFRLYDASMSGTLLWTETHDDVDVLSGVYYVELGSTTLITDAILSNATLYLEIEVGSETLSPRERLLAVPYALRSRNAETADLATSALTAQTLGTVESGFLSEILEHQSFDGQEPENFDAREGLGDADSDGVANFIDADNDNDGLLDGVEIAQGSDINLVTPTITGSVPSAAGELLTTVVSVLGTEFEAGVTVQFGSESPTPSNITPTSFDVSVGPQPPGIVAVSVTRLNGESDASTFEFFEVPIITGFVPTVGQSTFAETITVQGTKFASGMTVQFGSQTPTPSSVTSTSFDVVVGPQPAGFVNVDVTRTEGGVGSSTFEFVLSPTITGFTPAFGDPAISQNVTVTGTGFAAGMTVSFGSESPTPTNITPTSFDVTVGPQSPVFVNVQVTRLDGGKNVPAQFEFADALVIFTTQATFDGNLGGIAGADATCASEASTAGLPGTFLAWISAGSTSPDSRFTKLLPYRLAAPVETIVASSWADLTDATLAVSVDTDATGTAVVAQPLTSWTNTLPTGLGLGNDCSDWTSTDSGQSGLTGKSDATTGSWSQFASKTCNNFARLICVEQ